MRWEMPRRRFMSRRDAVDGARAAILRAHASIHAPVLLPRIAEALPKT